MRQLPFYTEKLAEIAMKNLLKMTYSQTAPYMGRYVIDRKLFFISDIIWSDFGVFAIPWSLYLLHLAILYNVTVWKAAFFLLRWALVQLHCCGFPRIFQFVAIETQMPLLSLAATKTAYFSLAKYVFFAVLYSQTSLSNRPYYYRRNNYVFSILRFWIDS